MKASAIVTVIALFLAAGCETGNLSSHYGTHESESWMAKSYNDVAIENAVIRQHTILPYHFQQNSDQLNELGNRDVDILAAHYVKSPGRLSVRRGAISSGLYEARVKTVLAKMSDAGVATDKVDVTDAYTGGDGMASEEVEFILSKRTKVQKAAPTAYYEAMSSTEED